MGTVLDWSGRGDVPAAKVGDPTPCVHCGHGAFLRHPVTGKPCHKVCEERLIDRRAARIAAVANGEVT